MKRWPTKLLAAATVLVVMIGGYYAMPAEAPSSPIARDAITVVAAPALGPAPAPGVAVAPHAVPTPPAAPVSTAGKDPSARYEPGAINYAEKGVLPAL